MTATSRTSATTAAPATTEQPRTAPSVRDTVQEFLRRVGAGETGTMGELFAAEVDWKVNWPESEFGRTDTPWIRHRTTGGELGVLFGELRSSHVTEETDTQVERILVDGADAVILGELRQTARPTGRAYRARFALHLTVEDGRITRYHIYEDSLAVARAFDTTAATEPAA